VRVTAIVLAAGASRRLGTPKQNVMLGGETLVERTIRIATEAGVDRTVVVVQPGMLADLPDRVENAEHEEGMAASIRAGVRVAEGRVLILLCDQTRITSEHLRALIATGAPIVATGYEGIAGAPAIFAPRFVPELLALRGDVGARGVIDAHRDETVVIPFEPAAVDLDSVSDLQKR
jgi:molybdenum cofactor cytidylyltransferase